MNQIVFSSMVIGVTLAFAGSPRADVLSFDPQHGTFGGTDTLVVSVVVDDSFTDIRGLSFVFEFDPAVVSIESVTAGQLFRDSPCDEFIEWRNEAAVGDSIAVDIAGLGCSVAGPGALLDFRFTGVVVGTSPIACRSGTIRNAVNEDLPFTCLEGTIDYVKAVPVERASWASIRQRYLPPRSEPPYERGR